MQCESDWRAGMNADAGDGDMISQRRLPAGVYAPRSCPRPTPYGQTTRAEYFANRWPPRRKGNAFLTYRGWPTQAPELDPPNIPSNRAKPYRRSRHPANSRFLTDCYLFPAALLSAGCRKIAQAGIALRKCEIRPDRGLDRARVALSRMIKN